MSCKIAVASTFSPRFLSVLGSAAHFAKVMNGKLHILHAAAADEEKQTRFREGIATVGLPADTPVLWKEAEEPALAVLSLLEENQIDVVIAGALEREPEHRNFTGNVARDLLLRCKCDLVLLTHPEQEPQPRKRIAIAVDLTDPDPKWLSRALAIAKGEGSPLVNVFSILTPFDKFKEPLDPNATAEAEARLQKVVESAGDYEGDWDCRIIRSNTGFNACEIIQGLKPDLLLAKRSKAAAAHSLPIHMDWLDQVIPANTMIFRS